MYGSDRSDLTVSTFYISGEWRNVSVFHLKCYYVNYCLATAPLNEWSMIALSYPVTIHGTMLTN
jgi:hypothetical protein